MENLRQRVQSIVDDTLRDFAEELPETSKLAQLQVPQGIVLYNVAHDLAAAVVRQG
jgi:hypothetical protein